MEFEGSGLFYEVVVTNSSGRGTVGRSRNGDPWDESWLTPKTHVVAYESNDPKLETAHAFGDSTPESEGARSTLEMVHAFVEKPDKIRRTSRMPSKQAGTEL